MKNLIDFDVYPDWAKRLIVDEQSGKYSSFQIIDDPVGKNLVNGNEILEFLEKNNFLYKTFNIKDFTHIGPKYFFDRFCMNGIYYIPAWNSLIESRSGELFFPKVHFYKQELETLWVPLNSNFLYDMSPIFLKN